MTSSEKTKFLKDISSRIQLLRINNRKPTKLIVSEKFYLEINDDLRISAEVDNLLLHYNMDLTISENQIEDFILI